MQYGYTKSIKYGYSFDQGSLIHYPENLRDHKIGNLWRLLKDIQKINGIQLVKVKLIVVNRIGCDVEHSILVS